MNTTVQNDNLGYYLAGLFEGDGHTGPKSFHITFHINQLPLVEALAQKLGLRSIRLKKENNACVLNVQGKELISFINLINGKLRTPKVYGLYKVIDNLNLQLKQPIAKLPLSSEPMDKNAWLAGFIDADGSFGICNTVKGTKAKKRQVRCRFRLEQRRLDPKTGASYEAVLSLIARFLHVKLNLRHQKKTGRTYFSIDASSLTSVKKLRAYLDTYPLWSSKFLDYKDWCKVHDLILQKLQFSEAGLAQITLLKQGCNLKRTFFDWSHLEERYNTF
jgi:hypothetical protein